ncbi:hypothetical protein BpHYR1_019777 [Brachionus plicatilis]|uniref:Uncharacterized protein n=1 Tax=Brachionus plicatilis TaxID=10195 RepID=A0A3M7PI61_BRAPC|nr:hypothetical protein BpHYR1_019777 [Brachionus plicatilis]
MVDEFEKKSIKKDTFEPIFAGSIRNTQLQNKLNKNRSNTQPAQRLKSSNGIEFFFPRFII